MPPTTRSPCVMGTHTTWLGEREKMNWPTGPILSSSLSSSASATVPPISISRRKKGASARAAGPR